MSRLPWFRMYNEARTDRKLATLSDHEFRVWFNLLCFSAEQDERGIIPECDDYMLAIEVGAADGPDLRVILDKLERLRVVSRTPDWDADNLGNDDEYGYQFGVITFVHFNDRNHDHPSAHPERVKERVQRHREAKRNAEQNHETESNDLETTLKRPSNDQDKIEIREEIERETTSPLPPKRKEPPPQEIHATYEHTLNGAMPTSVKKFSSIDKQLTEVWLRAALLAAEVAVGPLSRSQLGHGIDLTVDQVRRATEAGKVHSPRAFAQKVLIDYLTEQKDAHHAA